MKVKDVMTAGAHCISNGDSCELAARMMSHHDIGCLPVCHEDRLVGFLTDRDIVVRCLATGRNPLEEPVHAVMSEGCYWCFEDQEIENAEALMEEHQIRRLAVLDRDKRLVGMLSLGDLATRTRDEHMIAEVLEKVCEPA